MAIDADLAAGVIDQEEAKGGACWSHRIDFYGPWMEPQEARGDAIAGLLILLINPGVTIGLLQYDLTFDQQPELMLLTIGDGLVAQIPALIISLATALIVARVSRTSQLPEQAATQLVPMAFYITGSILGT